MLFVFDGGEIRPELADQIAIPADELSDWRFHDETGLEAALIPRLARRVIVAVNARRQAVTTYLEHGSRPVA